MRFSDRGGTERRNALCNGLAGSEILARVCASANRPHRAQPDHGYPTSKGFAVTFFARLIRKYLGKHATAERGGHSLAFYLSI